MSVSPVSQPTAAGKLTGSRRRRLSLAVVASVLGLSVGWCGAMSSAVAVASPAAWSIRILPQPTYFSPAHDAQCEVNRASRKCNGYTLIVTNVGGAKSNGPLVIADTLPVGLAVAHIKGEYLATGAFLSCTEPPLPLQCTDPDEGESAVAPGQTLLITVNVTVAPGTPTPGVVEDRASVAGGGAPAVAASVLTTVSSSPAPFGVADFSMRAFGEDGGNSTQAGGHPDELVTSFDLNSVSQPHGLTGENEYAPPEQLKDVVVELPVGFLGDPLTTPRCPLNELPVGVGVTLCPKASRVGIVTFEHEGFFSSTEERGLSVTAIYNMEPEAGYPAEFGFTYLNKPVLIYANLVRVEGRYRLRVTSPGVPEIGTEGASVTFFGNPAQRDESEATGPGRAFFDNPVDCSSEPLTASIRVDSWEHPQHPAEYTAPVTSVVYPQIAGCDMLALFRPTLTVRPETTRADQPSGYEFDLAVPQEESLEAPATPELRDATVTLPRGVSLSPAVAGGLRACRETGPEGINIEGPEASELGEGARDGSPYHDGQEHTAPGHCPAASTVGSVEVITPLLPKPLEGHVYVAEPGCGGAGQPVCTEADAANGSLYGLYLEVAGSGAIVKLHGAASVDPVTGQVTATFREDPQLPFSEFILRLKDGPRAPLANPQACGSVTTTSDLVPWSSPTTPDASPFSSFPVDWDGVGGACPASLPFAPSFSAGTIAPAAGAFSPFTLTLSRGDREQDLAQVAVHTPPGLLGMLSSVTLCGEPQAAQGACSSASQIGSVTAAVGAGSDPFWVQGGRAYLTGPYRGAPFGLSIVVPAVAGPFNLGNVVVRAAITIDPLTSQITVTSAQLPRIIDGVPLRLRTVNVTVDRPGFMFNPTSCARQQITATVAGSQGATAQVASPFTASGCATLKFTPKFTVSTSGKTSKADGASLDTKVSFPAGSVGSQANIAYVKVDLPKQLPSRLTTLQKACLAATFEANPASCPAASVVGTVRASTPVLPVQLTGPVYFVSHGGEAFPSLEIVLQGEGVRVDLVGTTFISKAGITSSTFKTVPDVPVSTFELYLPEGKYSALAANGNLCAEQSALKMPTDFVGQNGAVLNQTTQISVTGCAPAITVLSHRVKGRTATIVVSVPAAGRLVASARGLSKGTGRSTGASTVTVKLTLNNGEVAVLKKHPGRKLAARVNLTFTPKKGSKLKTSVTVLVG